MAPRGAGLGGEASDGGTRFCTSFRKNPFLPVVHVHQAPWPAAAWGPCCGCPRSWGGPGWPLPPCPQRLCAVVPARDHPLLPRMTPHGCFARQKPSSFSHVRPQRLCFPPRLPALCLPSPSPAACSCPGADFCPPRARPAGPGCPSQGLAQDKPLVGAACAHRSPHRLRTPDSAGAPLRSTGTAATRCYFDNQIARAEETKSGRNFG